MENVKEPFSTTEMVAEIFKAMSEASGRGVSCLYHKFVKTDDILL